MDNQKKQLFAMFYVMDKMPSGVVEAATEDDAMKAFVNHVNTHATEFKSLFDFLDGNKLLTLEKCKIVGTNGVIPFILDTDLTLDQLIEKVKDRDEPLDFKITLDGIESGQAGVEKTDIFIHA